jgi:hypothetical protein
MYIPPELGSSFMNVIRPVYDGDYPDHEKLRAMWDIMCDMQGVVLGQQLLRRIGSKVFAGPFRGMELSPAMIRGRVAPILLGTYEWELHDAIEVALAKPYKNVINVGCSNGYYAVGFAMRMPEAKIFAYDTDPEAQANCKALAALNGVEDRVVIGGAFTGAEFEKFAGEETLVFMDVDTAERELLDVERAPVLKNMDVIVELHDCIVPALSTVLPFRFAPTHDVRVIPGAAFSFPLEKVMGSDYIANHFDNLLVTWEGRQSQTAFGVFNRKVEKTEG